MNHNLKAKFIRQYKQRETGNNVFVYSVKGSDDAMQAYEEARGEFHRVDEKTGDVLWFNSRFCGDDVKLVVNGDNGKVYADMTEFNKIQSLTEQFGGVLGQEIARQAVSRLFGKATVEETAKVDA